MPLEYVTVVFDMESHKIYFMMPGPVIIQINALKV